MNSSKVSTLSSRFEKYLDNIDAAEDLSVKGRLTRVVGLKLEAVGFVAPLGTTCLIESNYREPIEAELVGFSGDTIFLMSAEDTLGISPGATVIPLGHFSEVAVGEHLLGRVIDGAGHPLDNLPPIKSNIYYPLTGKNINPLSRHPISQPLDVGIRAINALLTVGRGQRIGLFAGSGVGKSVLLGMMTKFTTADVIVVGLIGERGREVKEFIEESLGAEGMSRSVVVAAPADAPPLMRLHGAMWATSIAEYFRDQGKKVLLLVDSLTRFAQAQRELSLSLGEPPATKGYTPSVFSKLSQLVERAGNDMTGEGSITAFYTVLAEGDDQNDPIADSARSFLDGHIVLSRFLAEEGHYPAIDIEASISRVMPAVVSKEHLQLANQLKGHYSRYQQNRDLIKVGAYVRGADPELEKSLALIEGINNLLKQGMKERVNFQESINGLESILR
jgi:flagellum-specific ATP synthase